MSQILQIMMMIMNPLSVALTVTIMNLGNSLRKQNIYRTPFLTFMLACSSGSIHQAVACLAQPIFTFI